MALYTIDVRTICESYLSEEVDSYNDVDTLLDLTWDDVFDFDFPIFSEAYRETLCKKILKHYFTREIGSETVGLWKLRLNTKLNEIMPYYNKLYTSELIDFDPMKDYDLIREIAGTTDTDRTGTVKNVGGDSRWSKFSDTPQGGLGNFNGDEGDDEDEWLTNVTHNYGDDNNTETRNLNDKTSDTRSETVVGKIGGTSYSKLIEEYRKTFLNIDVRIINELKDLFIGLWN